MLALGGGGYFYIQKLQSDLETARANVERMKVAVETAEESIKTLQEDAQKMQELNSKLQTSLQEATAYGDDLRSKLQRHNLTVLAIKEPNQLEGKMNSATAKLWRELEKDTGGTGDTPLPSWLLSPESGTGNSNSNENRKDDSTSSQSPETN